MSAFQIVSLLNNQVVLTAGPAISAGTQSQNTGTIIFSNSNGVSFGLNAGTITASAVGGGGGGSIKMSAGTLSASRSDVTFGDSNGVSFGLNTNGVITATVKTDYLTTQSVQPVAVSGSNGSFAYSTLTFGISNGATFYTTNGSVVVSYTVPSQSVQPVAVSGSNGSFAFSTVTFGQSNGATFYTTNGSVVVSYTVPSQSVQPVAISGSNGSFAFSTASFGQSNGATFYTTNGSVVVSYTVPNVPAQTNQTGGIYASVNTTGQSSSSTYDARSLSVVGQGVASVGWSNGSLLVSVPSGGGAGDGVNIIAAGTQTAATTGTVLLQNSNGISFGMSNSSVVTASYTVPSTAGLLSAINVSAGTTSNNLSALTVANSNGVSFGLNGSVLTATVQTNYLTTAMLSNAATISNINVSAGTTSANLSNFTIANSNGVSFGLSNGVITATVKTDYQTSGAYLTTAMQSNAATISNINLSAGTTSQNLSKFQFNDGGGVSFGLNGSTITATVQTNYLTSQSNQAVSNSAGSFTFQTLNFSNANNVTFGTSAGGIITASVAAPGAAAENNWFNLLGANTAGNTTASGSTIGLSGINLTLSGTNGSAINISAPATSSLSATGLVSIATNGSTISVGVPATNLSYWIPDPAFTVAGSLQGNSSVSIVPMTIQGNIAFSQVQLPISVNGATTTNNTSGGMAISASVVLYSRNVSTLSSINSGSFSTSTWASSNATASMFGLRPLELPLASATTLTAGDYWMAVHIATATAGNTSLAKSISMCVIPTFASGGGVINDFGAGMTNTRGLIMGLAIHSTGATLASIAFTDITGHSGNSASLANLWFAFRNYTIW